MNDSKVNPVEAQAVPDQPVATVTIGDTALGNGMRFTALTDAGRALPPGKYELFTHPTPAAADLREALERVCSHKPRTPAQIDADWNFARAALAASPAAEAGVPTVMPGFVQVPVDVADNWRAESAFLHGVIAVSGFHDRADASEDIVAYIERIAATSPVAPVGAPTLTDEQINDLWDRSGAAVRGSWRATAMHFARALLSAQGCELATDATKQREREHSVHLAATPIDQDFRRRPASSEAAPSDDLLQDAARYRWLRGKTGAGLKDIGSLSPSFRLPHVTAACGTDLMKGSVAQHLDAAIDDAMKEQK